MQHNFSKNPINSNQYGERYFLNDQFADIHCHCLPGLDDGPIEINQALALCRALVDDGINSVIATPHQLGRYGLDNQNQRVREVVTAMNQELKINNIDLSVVPGGDVRVDERICDLIKQDKILTLADGGKYILLELPHEIFIDIEPLLSELTDDGISAIISHPERHDGIRKNKEILHKWLEYSCYLQVTAGSLLGFFGINAQKFSWNILNQGMVSIVATDSHNLTSRGPCMSKAFEEIKLHCDEKLAKLFCIENPKKVLKGQQLDFCPLIKATYVF